VTSIFEYYTDWVVNLQYSKLFRTQIRGHFLKELSTTGRATF
jgi:hypothetical protein